MESYLKEKSRDIWTEPAAWKLTKYRLNSKLDILLYTPFRLKILMRMAYLDSTVRLFQSLYFGFAMTRLTLPVSENKFFIFNLMGNIQNQI